MPNYEFMKNQNKLFEEKPFVSENVFGMLSKSFRAKEISRFQIGSYLNIILLILIGFLVIWYAVWVNFIIAGQYDERLFKDKLESLTEENNQLLSEKSNSANLGALLVFSKTSGLVEQKNIEYLFRQQNVAGVSQDLVH